MIHQHMFTAISFVHFLRFCNFERIEKMAEEVDEDAHGRDDKVGFLFFGLLARFSKLALPISRLASTLVR